MAVSGEARARVLTTLLILPALALLWTGGWVAASLVILAGVVMLAEALAVSGMPPGHWRGAAVLALGIGPALMALAAAVFPAAPLPPAQSGAFWACAGLAALVLAALGRSRAMSALLAAIALALAGGVALAFDGGRVPWLVVVAVVVAAADIAAYLVGGKVGGPKLAPSISPSKTWSGAAAGLAAGCLAGAALGILFSLPPLTMAVAGLLIADFSIGGDLLESMFKRAHGVKNAGSILPGHGGALDRFDGYLLVLPSLCLAVGMGWLQGGAHG